MADGYTPNDIKRDIQACGMLTEISSTAIYDWMTGVKDLLGDMPWHPENTKLFLVGMAPGLWGQVRQCFVERDSLEATEQALYELCPHVSPLIQFLELVALRRTSGETIYQHSEKFKNLLRTTTLTDPSVVPPMVVVAAFLMTCYEHERNAALPLLSTQDISNWETAVKNVQLIMSTSKAPQRAQRAGDSDSASKRSRRFGGRGHQQGNAASAASSSASSATPGVSAQAARGYALGAQRSNNAAPPPPPTTPAKPSVSEEFEIFALMNPHTLPTGLPFTQHALFCSSQCVVLFDTGSSVNLVSRAFLHSMAAQPPAIRRNANQINLVFADSSKSSTSVLVKDYVTLFSQTEYPIEAYEADLPDQIHLLIGTKFICQYGLMLDGVSKTVTTRPKKDQQKSKKLSDETTSDEQKLVSSSAPTAVLIPPSDVIETDYNLFVQAFSDTNKVELCLPILVSPQPTTSQEDFTFYDLLDTVDDFEFRAILTPFSQLFASKLPAYDESKYPLGIYMDIIIKPGCKPPSLKWRPMSYARSSIVQNEVAELEAKGLIYKSQSPFTAPPLLVTTEKKHRLCYDFTMLNNVTEDVGFAMPNPNELFERLATMRVFSSFDLTSSFSQIRITPEHQKYASFDTPWGVYTHRTACFGLKNSGKIFMYAMSIIFEGMEFLIIFVDDVVVASTSREAHKEHLARFLAKAAEYGLILNPKKANIAKSKIKFLGHIIEAGSISVDPDKIQQVLDFPLPTNVSEMRAFCGLFSYFRRFIYDAAELLAPLNDLTKKNVPFVITDQVRAAFNTAKQALSKTLTLQLPKQGVPFTLYTDASRTAIGACLMQEDKPVAFFSKKLVGAEIRYSVHDQELFAIYCALKHFKSYLFGSSFKILSDHRTLQYIMSQGERSERNALWLSCLADFGVLDISWVPGELNQVADFLSRANLRNSDWVEEDTIVLFNHMHITPQLDEPCFTAIDVTAYSFVPDSTFLNRVHKASAASELLHSWHANNPQQFVWDEGILYYSESGTHDYDRRMCLPPDDELITKVISEHHDIKVFAHRSPRMTYLQTRLNFFWLDLHKDIMDYCKSCESCQLNKHKPTKPEGRLLPIQVSYTPWETMCMDFSDMPLDAHGNDKCLVVVDRLTKFAILAPCKKTDDAPAISQLFFKAVISYKGIPSKIISDADPIFMSAFFKELHSALGSSFASTVSGRAEADGQSERTIETLKIAMRHYVDHDQANWSSLLGILQLAYNRTPTTVAGLSPMQMECGVQPRMPADVLVRPHESRSTSAAEHLENIAVHLARARDALAKSFLLQADQHNKHRDPCTLQVGDWVMVKNTRLNDISEGDRPKQKLAAQFAGPFQIDERLSPNNFKLLLPLGARVSNTFNADQLYAYIPSPDRFSSRPHVDPRSFDENGEKLYTVETLLERRKSLSGTTEYRVKYLGYPDTPEDTCWISRESLLDTCPVLVHRFDNRSDTLVNTNPDPPLQPLIPQRRGRGRPRKNVDPRTNILPTPPIIASATGTNVLTNDND